MSQLHARRAQPSQVVESKAWIAERHYLQSAPPSAVHVYEFMLDGAIVGGALLGRPSGPGYNPDRILELTRYFFIDETPLMVESRGLALVRKHVRVWLPAIRLLVAYSDPGAGHEGTIYEADGWAEFGRTKAGGSGWANRPGRRVVKRTSKIRWVRTP